MVRETAREFAEKYIRPHVMEWDEAQHFPVNTFKQLGELGLMRVEHVETGLMVLIGEFQDAALSLALHNSVDRLQRRRQRRSVIVVIEEVAMQVE